MYRYEKPGHRGKLSDKGKWVAKKVKSLTILKQYSCG
jgi:hypothetical protein